MGTGFIHGTRVFKGGTWTPPEVILSRTLPVAFTTNLAPALVVCLNWLFIGLDWIGKKSIWVSQWNLIKHSLTSLSSQLILLGKKTWEKKEGIGQELDLNR